MIEGGGRLPADILERMSVPTDVDPDNCDCVDVHVGQQLKTLRMMRGLSQPDLAARLGVSFQQLQKYERGDNRISASKLYLAAAALKVEVGRLFEGLPDPAGGPADQAMLAAQREMVAFLAEPEGRDLALNLPSLPRFLRAHVASLVRAMAAQVAPEDRQSA